MKTLYQKLRITPQATPRMVQQAFLRLARKYDPSLPQNQANPDAPAQYDAINEAYRTLIDPDRRYLYDQSLQMLPFAERVRSGRANGGDRKRPQG